MDPARSLTNSRARLSVIRAKNCSRFTIRESLVAQSCHWGNGRATTSEVKGHGRHKYWLWPMFEKENTEAGCQQCHAKDRVTQGADTLNLAKDLFYRAWLRWLSPLRRVRSRD